MDFATNLVTFTVQGAGQLIGENPVKLRAGKMIILARSTFVPGEMTISAKADGLLPAHVSVRTTSVPPDVDFPKDLSAKEPACSGPLCTSTTSN